MSVFEATPSFLSILLASRNEWAFLEVEISPGPSLPCCLRFWIVFTIGATRWNTFSFNITPWLAPVEPWPKLIGPVPRPGSPSFLPLSKTYLYMFATWCFGVSHIGVWPWLGISISMRSSSRSSAIGSTTSNSIPDPDIPPLSVAMLLTRWFTYQSASYSLWMAASVHAQPTTSMSIWARDLGSDIVAPLRYPTLPDHLPNIQMYFVSWFTRDHKNVSLSPCNSAHFTKIPIKARV